MSNTTTNLSRTHSSTRVTPQPGGDVLVERLQSNGRWLLRRYRKDSAGYIAEVRPNGSCFPVGLGLRASLSPLLVDGDLIDTIATELVREPCQAWSAT
jgi:hypothetical protein